MARSYDRALVARIGETARVIDVRGLPVELRPVPDDDREHALDPRVLASTIAKLEPHGADVPMSDVLAMRKRPVRPTFAADEDDVSFETRLIRLEDRAIYVHLWRPEGMAQGAPVAVYLHGGYFAFGCVEERDALLRHLAASAGCLVAYPEYRLAPECPYPAAVDDCEACVEWLAENAAELGIDATHVAAVGDSAGGSLANALAMRLAKRRPLSLVATMYAVVDSWPATKEMDFSYAEFECLPEQEVAVRNRIDRIRNAGADDLYTAGDSDELRNPEISAWHAPDVSMFPRTVVAYSEFDFLRCQNERWARRLWEEGVDVRCVRYCGCDHGFLERFGVAPQAEDFAELVAAEMRGVFGWKA